MSIPGGAILGSSVLDLITGREENKSRIEAQNLQNAENQRAQKAAISAQQVDNPLYSNRFDPATGGFKQDFVGSGDAQKTAQRKFSGDIGRAENVNEATNNFSPTLPDLSAARNIIAGDNQLQQTGIIDPGVNKLVQQNTRQFGGLNNSGAGGSLVDALAQFSARNRIGGEKDAISLKQGSDINDQDILKAIIANNQSQGNVPTIPTGGGAAANAILGTKGSFEPSTSDLALASRAGGNAVQQYFEGLERDKSNALQREILNKYLNTLAAQKTAQTQVNPVRPQMPNIDWSVLGEP